MVLISREKQKFASKKSSKEYFKNALKYQKSQVFYQLNGIKSILYLLMLAVILKLNPRKSYSK